MIQVHDVRKTYDGRPALDGFNLHVAEGELFGLVGPNGAGKSTLIKMLATLVVPNEGTARVAGIDVQYEPEEVKKIVGYMPDQPGLYQEMRLREFLQFFADAFLILRSKQPAAIAAALQVAGLTERKEQFVEELSFGLKQRLFLAKTLLHKPKVLLLDEPATGLDPIARLDLRKQLKELNARGVTILISSHILADLEDICTRVALISHGKNVTSVEGHNMADLSRPDVEKRIYDIEVLGEGEAAGKALEAIGGVRILSRADNKFSVEVPGGATEGAALLRGLITAGTDVARFDYRSGSLEALYQEVFGAKQP